MKFKVKHLLPYAFKHSTLFSALAMGLVLNAGSSQALDYGIYDSRSLAMGGAGVASATAQHAMFYNPALLAFYDGDEEDTRHGRVYLPLFVAQINDTIEDVIDVVDQDLDGELTIAVQNFNADPTNDDNAAAVATAGTNLLNGINSIGNRQLEAEAFLGFMVSEPSDREGGSFYFGSRAIAAGGSTVTQEDLDLLQRYIDAMQSDMPELEFPDLFNADGSLVDPADEITSSADIGSLVISEWGVAVSKEFEFWGVPVALGATPKVMHVDIYRNDLDYADSDYNFDEDRRTYVTINTDVGVALPLGKYFRVALASKDIIPQTYEGGNDLSVDTQARTRFAAAFMNSWLNIAMDVDLQKNKSLAGDEPGQELSVGTELNLIPWVSFRAGYRHDLTGSEEDILSAGAGFRVGRFVADGAYAVGNDTQSLGLQLGWTF